MDYRNPQYANILVSNKVNQTIQSNEDIDYTKRIITVAYLNTALCTIAWTDHLTTGIDKAHCQDTIKITFFFRTYYNI